MAAWPSKITRAEAEKEINKMIKDGGYKSSVKVFYDSNIITGPEELPEMVDMKLVKLSAKLDQA